MMLMHDQIEFFLLKFSIMEGKMKGDTYSKKSRKIFNAKTMPGILLGGLVVLYAGLASATPPYGVSGEVLADVVADHYLELKVYGINFEPETKFRLRTRRITIKPGGYGGWHSHSGPVIVSVLEGEYTFYDASDPECGYETLTAGEGWIKPGIGVHVPVNESADKDLVFLAVFFYPEGAMIRIDQPQPDNPNCPILQY